MIIHWKNNPIVARDYFIGEIGRCVSGEIVFKTIESVLRCKLESLSWGQAQNKRRESKKFACAWEAAKKQGMYDGVWSFWLYIYNEENNTVHAVSEYIDYVKVVECENAFARYALTCKPIMDRLMDFGEHTRKELREIGDLIFQLE